jgi:apolipoprotein N-acyltransferase
MKLRRLMKFLPSFRSLGLSAVSALILIATFPDFEYSFLAFIALTGLLIAAADESKRVVSAGVCGWFFGVIFFFGTTWWLAFAPIHYAGFPSAIAYSLVFMATAIVAIFPAVFSAIFAFLFRSFGFAAFALAPAIWIATEFSRYWITGNNWNAIAYSQAFEPFVLPLASFGGIYLTGGVIVGVNSIFAALLYSYMIRASFAVRKIALLSAVLAIFVLTLFVLNIKGPAAVAETPLKQEAFVIAVQPNVPMSGLTTEKWNEMASLHTKLAESALNSLGKMAPAVPRLVIFPESPMNFSYETDTASREFINNFARRNGVWLLVNSAEPDRESGKFFNSAVLVSPQGSEAAQYDKIFLLPFGEAVPAPLEGVLPAFVGSFAYGSRAELIPFGAIRAGVMICFESHFGSLSRQYAANGADVLIELTNDGYLGPTPVLRQHLANAVFRAVETGLPLIRVTNVGITALIAPDGRVIDPSPVYTEDVRIWSINRSVHKPTLYSRFGDWFAWISLLVVFASIGVAFLRRPQS